MQRDENEFRIRIGRSASDVRPALKQVRAGVESLRRRPPFMTVATLGGCADKSAL